MRAPLHRLLLSSFRPLVLVLAPATTVLAQAPAPFQADSRKLFASLPDHAATYSLAFDSAVADAGVTHYYNFFDAAADWVPSNCSWWGGPQCLPLTVPTWAGARIDADAANGYTFHNVWGEAITLPFHTDPSQPAVIYSDATQRFLLDYVGIAPSADVLGQMDDVYHWTLRHEDLGGTAISSALNGASVDIGDSLGLVRFFRIDSFPQVLTPIELMGQAQEGLGLFEITPAVVHDHQPGDVVQWHEVGHASMGPPGSNYDRYSTFTFLERTDLPDEVTYQVEHTFFDAVADTTDVSIITLSYDRTPAMASIPFERFDGTRPRLGEGDHCGMRLWHYRTTPNQGLAYCEEERCWGGYDTNGPPPYGWTDHIIGLGTTYSITQTQSIGGPVLSGQRELVYFEKNGTACGTEVIMGIGDNAAAPALHLAPMPSNGPLTVEAGAAMARLVLHDLTGALVLSAPLTGVRAQVDLSAARGGLYVATVIFANGAQARERVLLVR